ncbi:MAG: 50S ribosomal protein L32 [Bdellovibrionota bacterium]
MAVPKKKTSVSRKGKRHAGQHHKLSAKTVGRDATTGDYVLAHRVNPATGTYKGIKIFTSRTEKLALKAQTESTPE